MRKLTEIPTRQLLRYLKDARVNYGMYDYTVDELKAELSTRPHVPNKPEAKALRQKAAGRLPFAERK